MFFSVKIVGCLFVSARAADNIYACVMLIYAHKKTVPCFFDLFAFKKEQKSGKILKKTCFQH